MRTSYVGSTCLRTSGAEEGTVAGKRYRVGHQWGPVEGGLSIDQTVRDTQRSHWDRSMWEIPILQVQTLKPTSGRSRRRQSS